MWLLVLGAGGGSSKEATAEVRRSLEHAVSMRGARVSDVTEEIERSDTNAREG